MKSDNIITPVGRIIMGSLYNPRTQDREGRPLVYKTGAKTGQPRSEFFFALAIPKGAEVSQAYGKLNWATTTWGAEIYKAGCAFMSNAANIPTFAWKVGDGDSTDVNSAGNRLCDNEHARGHWIIFFNSNIAPRLCNADGSSALTEPDAILPGYYVQVGFNCTGNGSAQKPGVYINPVAVARVAFGEVIQTGVNTAALGFGVGVQLPPGASTTPLATLPAAAALPPAAALPNASFLQVPPPGTVAATTLPSGAVALPQYNQSRMVPGAAHTYELYKSAGYSDAAMIAAGVLLP